MIENINKLDKILSYFKFLQPVPESIQKQITEFKKKTIINTLKFFGQYNIFFGSALRLNLLLRKIGINLTIFQIKITLIIISALSGIVLLTVILFYLNISNISAEKKTINNIDMPHFWKNLSFLLNLVYLK